MQNLYKINDKVKVVKNNFGEEFDFYLGMVGTVIYVDDKNYHVEFKRGYTDLLAYCDEDEIVLFEE